jgi:hypothetical protein
MSGIGDLLNQVIYFYQIVLTCVANSIPERMIKSHPIKLGNSHAYGRVDPQFKSFHFALGQVIMHFSSPTVISILSSFDKKELRTM